MPEENFFIINARLPSLNDVINQSRTNRYAAANAKRDVQELIGWEIRRAVAKGTLHAVTEPCEVWIDFYERTKRRDVDGIISGGTKVILDAMVEQGILIDDGRKYVRQVPCMVYDGDKDYVVVKIKECGKNG